MPHICYFLLQTQPKEQKEMFKQRDQKIKKKKNFWALRKNCYLHEKKLDWKYVKISK